jgi:hypothetical protein
MKILNKIIKKEATVQEKLTYLLPAVISILYLIDIIFVLLLGMGLFRKLIPEFLNISKIIFIFTSIYAAYKNYDYFKKVTATSLLFVIICFFWIYISLYPLTIRSFGGIFVIVITLIQIYLFLNLHLDKKFNILNIDSVSSSFNLDFSKNKFNLNLFKNKFVIGALILFGAFIIYGINFEDNYHYNKNNSNFNSEGNLRNEAAKAVDAASACYRSLPSHAQKGSTVNSMLDARKYYDDGVKFLNMDQSYRSMATAYFNNAISYSNVVMQIGRAYSSRSCG